MKRLSVILSGAALALAQTTPARAQGVPIFDTAKISEQLAILGQLGRDEVVQDQKTEARTEKNTIKDRQLESIDRIREAFSGISTFPPVLDGGVSTAEGLSAGTELVYGTEANPAAGYVFGDAREDVEALIIRGANDTYGLPGVAAAGLSPLQWRCLLQALIWQESRFQIGARSPADAYGLTQIIPGTARQLGIYPEYYENPYLQVTGGARYLAEQLQAFNGNIIYALGAYNAGPGRIYEYDGVPPFAETQNYVRVIPQKYNEYLARIGGPEALGTIDPTLYAMSEASLLGHGASYYGSYGYDTASAALLRIRAIVEKIGTTADVKESYDLNTYLRAELILIMSSRIKLKAARTRAKSARDQMILAAQREAEKFLKFDDSGI